MARLKKIEEEKKTKKRGQGNKGRTSKKKSTPKEDMKIAYTPKTEAEKAALRADLIRRLKSGEYEPSYRWHGGRINVSDKH